MMALERYVNAAAILLAFVLIGYSLYTIVLNFTPIHYWDQWEMARYLAEGGELTLSYLLAKHNEHIIFTSKIIFFLDYYLFDYSNRLSVFFIVLLLGTVAFTLARITAGKFDRTFAFLFPIFAAVMLSLAQWENLTIGFQTQFGFTAIFAILSCIATQKYVELVSSLNGYLYLVFLTLAGTVLSMGNGIGIIIPLCLVLIANRADWRKIILVGMAYAVPLVIFLWQEGGAQSVSIFDDMQVLKIIAFFMAVVGSALSTNFPTAAVLGFVVFLIFSASAIQNVLVPFWAGRTVDRRTLTLVAISTYPIVSALAITYGRYTLGFGAALSSRYSTLDLLLLCSLLGIHFRSSRITTTGAKCAIFGILGVVVAITGTLKGGNGTRIEMRGNALRQASYFVLAGSRDTASLNALYPVPESILKALDFIRDEKLNIFSPDYGLPKPPAILETALANASVCEEATVREVSPLEPGSWAVFIDAESISGKSVPVWAIAIDQPGNFKGFAPPQQPISPWAFPLASKQASFALPVHLEDTKASDSSLKILLHDGDAHFCRLPLPDKLKSLSFQN